MKRTYFRLMHLSAALLCVGTAYACYFHGYVTDIQTVGGIALVQLSNGSGAQFACTATSTTGPALFWFDPTTSYGQATMALAITAKATGTLVYIQGNGTCTSAWPESNSEQVSTLSWSG